MKKLNQLVNQFVKFGIVGAINTILSYTITNIGFYVLGLHEQISNLVAFIITVFVSFILNGKFVFNENKAKEKNIKEWIISLLKVYASYSITGLILTGILLYFEETMLGIPHYIATLTNLIVTIPLNFILNKFWAFKEERGEKK